MGAFPKVWFDVMDPLTEAYEQRRVTSKVEKEVVRSAEDKARKFMLKMSLCLLSFWAFSFLKYYDFSQP